MNIEVDPITWKNEAAKNWGIPRGYCLWVMLQTMLTKMQRF